MSAPIHLDGPHVNRRRQRRRAIALAVLGALLLASPFIATAIAAGLRG